MDEEANSRTGDSGTIPLLDQAIEETRGPDETDQDAERIADRLERELARAFDRLVGDPVLEALSQGLASYQQQVRAIVLRELSPPTPHKDSFDPDR